MLAIASRSREAVGVGSACAPACKDESCSSAKLEFKVEHPHAYRHHNRSDEEDAEDVEPKSSFYHIRDFHISRAIRDSVRRCGDRKHKGASSRERRWYRKE